MDMIILVLTVAVFIYACIIHHKQDDTPEEYPTRMIMLFTFLSGVFQLGEIANVNWMSPHMKEFAWNLISVFVVVRLLNFLGDRSSRVTHGRHKEP